jgi:hypothetical protein
MRLDRIGKLIIQGQRVYKSKGALGALLVLLWGAGLGFIIWKAWESQEIIIPYLIGADLLKLIWVFFSYLASLIAAIIGWTAIMQAFDNSVGWTKNLQIFGTTLAARRLPGTFWYVGGRLLMYQQIGISNKIVIIASSIELTVTLITGAFLGLSFLLASGTNLPTQVIIAIVIGGIIGVLILHPSALRSILGRSEKNLLGKIGVRNILTWLVAYVIMWVMGGVMLSQIAAVFGLIGPVKISRMIGIWSLSGTAGILTFFLPSTFGITEVTIAALLAQLIPLPLAGVIAVFTRLATSIFEILLSAVFYPIFVARARAQSK